MGNKRRVSALLLFAGLLTGGFSVASAQVACSGGYLTTCASGCNYTTISAAVAAIPASALTGNWCVDIQDNGTYAEHVTVSSVNTNGYQIIIGTTTGIARPTVSPPASSNAAFTIQAPNVTIEHVNIVPTNSMPYGVQAGSASVTISSMSINDASGFITTAGVSIFSNSVVSTSTIKVQAAIGLQIITGGTGNTISLSTITTQGSLASVSAVYLNSSASNNTLSQLYVSNPAGPLLVFGTACNGNTISYSTFTDSNNSGIYSFSLLGASSNTITHTYIYTPGSIAMTLDKGGGLDSSYNTFSQDTIKNALVNGGDIGLYGPYNTFTQDFIDSQNSDGLVITLTGGAGGQGKFNTISQSTITSEHPGDYALDLTGSSNTISHCYIQNLVGNGAYLSSAGNLVTQSTMVSNSASYNALAFAYASTNTVTQSYIYNPAGTATSLIGSTGTVISSSILVGGTGRIGIQVGLGNAFPTTISQDTVESASYGLTITTQATGAIISLSSVTFQGLAAGATAIYFTGGSFVPQNFSNIDFADTNIAVNVNAAMLTGSTITMTGASGPRAGAQYDIDPHAQVVWPSTTSTSVCSGGYLTTCASGCNYTTISAAVAAIPTTALTGNWCVDIQDNGTYAEQVAVSGLSPNGYQIIIGTATGIARPTISPPGSSNAAFTVSNASVTISRVNIVPTNSMPYGVQASATNVTISSVSINDPSGFITTAGILASSWTTVSQSSVSVNSALAGIQILGSSNTVTQTYVSNPASTSVVVTGSYNTISFSTVTHGANSGDTLYVNGSYNQINNSDLLNGLAILNSGSNNQITNSLLTNSYAGQVDVLDIYGSGNLISSDTITSPASQRAALAIWTNSGQNTISSSFINNAVGGALMLHHSSSNTITQSTMTSQLANGNAAFSDDTGAYNSITHSYLQGGLNLIQYSTGDYMAGNQIVDIQSIGGNGSTALWIRADVNPNISSNTFLGTGSANSRSAIYLTENYGTVFITSATIGYGGIDTLSAGIQIDSQSASAILAISNVAFNQLQPGATAILFIGGSLTVPQFFSGMDFADTNLAVNVMASALAGSTITMTGAYGPRTGAQYDIDPNGQIVWPSSTPPGCAGGYLTTCAAGCNYTTISAAVAAIPTTALTGNWCVDIKDNGTYAEQVIVSSMITNGYQIIIGTTTGIARPTVSPPASSNAAFMIQTPNVTIEHVNIVPTNSMAYGVEASSTAVTISSISINDAGGFIWTAGVSILSNSVVSTSTIKVQGAIGLQITPGGTGNTVSLSTITSQGSLASVPAVYLISSASNNTLTQLYVSNSAGPVLTLGSGSNGNTISNSTFTDTVNSGVYSFSLLGASSNTITHTYVYTPGSIAMTLDKGGGLDSSYNTFSHDTIKNALVNGGDIGLYGPYNTFTQDFIDSQNSDGLVITLTGAAGGQGKFNTISQSTITSEHPGDYALLITASSNTMSQCYMQNLVGNGAYISSVGNLITQSTMVSNSASYNALVFASASTNTVTQSYIYNPVGTAASLSSSTGTIINGSVLVGGVGRAGIQVGLSNGYPTGIVSDTVQGASYGVTITSQATGAIINLSSVTFQGLAAGATAIYFTGGSFVPQTFSGVDFADTNIAVNVSAAVLFGSTITMAGPYGVRTGAQYDIDPNGQIVWPSTTTTATGCSGGYLTTCASSCNYTTISAAVAAIPTSALTGNWCVDIKDNGTYTEQVTVSGFNNNGYQIIIGTTTGATNPTVNPPASSTAAFVITNASVTIANINIAPTNVINYGVDASAANVIISSVNIADAGGKIASAGVAVSSWTTVSYTSVTLGGVNAYGFWLLPGSIMTSVSYSATAVNSATAIGLYLQGVSSNTFTALQVSNPSGYAAYLGGNANFNTISQSTMSSNHNGQAGGLYLSNANFTTVTRSVITNPLEYGVRMSGSHNTFSQDVITSSGSGSFGFLLSVGSYNTISQSYISNPAGYGVFIGDSLNTVSQSTVTGGNAISPTLVLEASSTTITQCYIDNPGGSALDIEPNLGTPANYNSISQSTITSGSGFGVTIYGSAFNTLSGDSVQGSTAVYVSGSTGTVIGGSTLATFNAAGSALLMVSESLNLTLSSSIVSAASGGTGINLAAGDAGQLIFASDTITGSRYGVSVAAQGAGEVLAIASMTFQNLTAGATAIIFTGGSFATPQTFSNVDFADTNIGVNINASALTGSTITMAGAYGPRTGAQFDKDPNGQIIWPSTATALSSAGFSAVTVSSLTVNWNSTLPCCSTLYYAQISTVSNFSTIISSQETYNLYAYFPGLKSNTLYYAEVSTSAAGPYTILGSTPTQGLSAAAFSGVTATGFTANWNSPYPAYMAYYVQVSTSSNFQTLWASTETLNLYEAFTGLNAGMVYYAQVSISTSGPFTNLGSVTTSSPTLSPAAYGGITETGVTSNWGSTYSGGTLYYVQLSTGALPNFFAGNQSTSTFGLSIPFGGLSAGTTYFGEVSTAAAGPFTTLGSVFTVAPTLSAASFTGVTAGGLTANWNSTYPGGTLYYAQVSTSSSFSSVWASSQTNNLNAAFSGLASGALYYAQVSTVAMGPFTNLGSTATLGLSAAPFTGITQSGLTANWNSSLPGGTAYFVVLSTVSNFAVVSSTIQTDNLFALFSGLNAGTTYFAEISTVSAGGPFLNLGSAMTVPVLSLSAAAFSGVTQSGLSANWNSTYPGGTLYFVELSTNSNFNTVLSSAATYNLYAAFAGLNATTLYYAQVSTSFAGPFTSLGSVATSSSTLSAAAFSGVGQNGLTANWNSAYPGGTLYYAQLSTGAFPNFYVGNLSSNTYNPAASFNGLNAGTLYCVEVGTTPGGPFISLGSVATSSAPVLTAAPFIAVTPNALTANWNSTYPGGTVYYVQLSTMSNFSVVWSSGQTDNLFAPFGALNPGTTYYAEVSTVSAVGPFVSLGSTITVPIPVLSAAVFSGVTPNALTANWNSTYPGGTLYFVQLSTISNFSTLWSTAPTYNLFAPFNGLYPGTLYYAEVSTTPAGPFTSLSSVVTSSSALAPAAYSGVTQTALTANWTSVFPPGTLYYTQLSSGAFPNAYAGNQSSNTYNLWASFNGLNAGTLYFTQVATAAAGSFTSLGSVPTSSAPVLSGAPFSAVSPNALTVNWNSTYPGGTVYYVQLSTVSNFSIVWSSGQTGNLFAPFGALNPGTTYYTEISTVSAVGPFISLGSTTTFPVQALSAAAFSGVTQSGLTANWNSTFPGGTLYFVQLSTNSNFNTLWSTAPTYNLFASYTGLVGGTLYYAQVSTVPAGPFTSLGSVATSSAALSAASYSGVTQTALTANWYSSYLPGTLYYTQLSSGAFPNAYAGNQSSNTYNLWASYNGLNTGTTYYTQVATAAAGPFVSLGFTVTPSSTVLWAAAYSAITPNGLRANWNSSYPAGTLYYSQLSTGAFPNFYAGNQSSNTYNLWASFNGLNAGTLYFAQVATAAAGPFISLSSVNTSSAPVLMAAPFSAVMPNALTANWNSTYLGGTVYYVELSTMSNFSVVWSSGQTENLFAPFGALNPGTTYYAQISTVSAGGPFVSLGSTITVPIPVLSAAAITGVTPNGLTANWNSTFPGGTLYFVELSTWSNFSLIWSSQPTYNFFASFTGLYPGLLYFAQVSTGPTGPFTGLGSVITSSSALAGAGYSGIAQTGLIANWTTVFPPGTLYYTQLSTGAFPNAYAGNQSSNTYNLFAGFAGLNAGTLYYAQVATAAAGSFTSLGSVATSSAPVLSAAAFSGVGQNALTANWNSTYPGGTLYYVQLSTGPGFGGVPSTAQTVDLYAAFGGLSGDTLYYARVGTAAAGPFTNLGSVATSSAPTLSAGVFSGITETGLTANWNSTYSTGTLYFVELSTNASFNPLWSSVPTYNLFASFAGLTADTRYFAQVSTSFAGPFTLFGSVLTASGGLAAAGFTGVSENGLTVVWISTWPAGTLYYTQLSTGAFPNAYAGNQSSNTYISQAGFSGLNPNTLYYAEISTVAAGPVTSLGSVTTSSAPTLSAAAFSGVGQNALTANWNSTFAGGTLYFARISTNSNFNTIWSTAQTVNLYASFAGLNAGALYYAEVATAAAGSFTSLGSVATSSAPVLSPAAFSGVTQTGLTANWNSTWPGGTLYYAQLSIAPFPNALLSNQTLTTYALSEAFSGLGAGTTYYAEVSTSAGGSFVSLGSAQTLPALSGPPGTPSPIVLGVSSISWTWSAGANSVSYDVYEATGPPTFISTAASAAFTQTGLFPNTGYSIAVAGVNASGIGTLSPAPALAYTKANPPTGTAVSQIAATSALISWQLNSNPVGTTAVVQSSTSAGGLAPVFSGAVTQYAATGLLGCTTYYVRVQNQNFGGLSTAFDATQQFLTLNTVPAPATSLSAAALAGSQVALSWIPSPTEGIVEYLLYYDAGTGTVNYAAPLAVFPSTQTSFTTGVLVSSAAYTFALRALHRCGVEETTGIFAIAATTQTLTAVRAVIKSPESGRHINGNSVTVMASLISGTPDQVEQIAFQYRVTGSTAWTNVPAGDINHPNPDTVFPYFIHWDVVAVPPGSYDLRAVATSVGGIVDSAPGAITVVVDPVNPDINGNVVDGKVQAQQQVNNAVTNNIGVGGTGMTDPSVNIVLPPGALSASTVTLTVVSNPTIATGCPSGYSFVGSAMEVDLGNGQHALSGGNLSAITLSYPPNTTFSPENLQIWSLDPASGQWSQDFATIVNVASHTVTGFTPHFSIFAVIAGSNVAGDLSSVRVYPNPYKPNSGNSNEGKPFDPGDPTSGIVFDNLPGVVNIKIYTISGRLVATFDSSSGAGAVHWDVANADGRGVASGGYFAVISSPGFKTVVRKLAIIR
jgi:hypothetical protein